MKMDDSLLGQFDTSWSHVLDPFLSNVRQIEKALQGKVFYPESQFVFRALAMPLESVRVVIFGQDPYPTPGNANGLAFSVPNDVNVPASLRNIFKEYQEDMGRIVSPPNDLSTWSTQGVLLLNRALTYSPDRSISLTQWAPITNAIARELGKRDVVAILWGNDAKSLKHYFRSDWVIESAHPSPLSAYRGFFGSKPFTRTNQILEKHSLHTIKW